MFRELQGVASAAVGSGQVYAVAAAAAATAGRPDAAGVNAGIIATGWIESRLSAGRVEMVCASAAALPSARASDWVARSEARRIYKHGRSVGIIPAWLFGGWWWLRIILALVNHWLALRGEWVRGEAAAADAVPE